MFMVCLWPMSHKPLDSRSVIDVCILKQQTRSADQPQTFHKRLIPHPRCKHVVRLQAEVQSVIAALYKRESWLTTAIHWLKKIQRAVWTRLSTFTSGWNQETGSHEPQASKHPIRAEKFCDLKLNQAVSLNFWQKQVSAEQRDPREEQKWVLGGTWGGHYATYPHSEKAPQRRCPRGQLHLDPPLRLPAPPLFEAHASWVGREHKQRRSQTKQTARILQTHSFKVAHVLAWPVCSSGRFNSCILMEIMGWQRRRFIFTFQRERWALCSLHQAVNKQTKIISTQSTRFNFLRSHSLRINSFRHGLGVIPLRAFFRSRDLLYSKFFSSLSMSQHLFSLNL